MAKIQDKFFNRIIEGDVIFQENEQVQVQSLMEKGEPMIGYRAETYETEGLTIEPVYCGVVKNGNKLTMVFAVNLTKTAEIAAQQSILNIFIPSKIGVKLYPSQVGIYTFLDNKVLKAWKSYLETTDVYAFINKERDDLLIIRLADITSLELNTKYYLRYEATFLLSDNLIPNA